MGVLVNATCETCRRSCSVTLYPDRVMICDSCRIDVLVLRVNAGLNRLEEIDPRLRFAVEERLAAPDPGACSTPALRKVTPYASPRPFTPREQRDLDYAREAFNLLVILATVGALLALALGRLP